VPLGDGYERNWGQGNDSIDDAFYLGAAAGFQVDGLSIHSRSDVDWYSFWLDQTGTANDFLQIDFSHLDGDLDLELFDDQQLLVESSESTSDNERIELAGIEGGRNYFVYVGGYSGASNDYSLTVSAQPHQFTGDWKETSDNTTLLPEINPGLQLTQLSIHTAADVDFFWFLLQSSGTESDYIKAHSFQTDSIDLDLVLYDADSEFIREATSTLSNEYLSLDGLDYGWYQVGVFAADNSFVAGSSYTLDLFGPAPADVDRYEPNGLFSEAIPLAGATDIRDISITADDYDIFSFTIPSAGTSAEFVEIQFDHAAGDLELELYDASNNLIDGSYGVTDIERVDFRQLAAGDYQAVVFGTSATDTGEYYLRVVYPPVLSSDAHEDDDQWQDATDIGIIDGRVEYKTLSIDAANDDDWFQFQLGDWGIVGDRIELDFEHERGNLGMVLYEKSGDEFIPIQYADGTTDQETIDLSDLAPISYYLQVYGLGDTNPDYQLTLLQSRTLAADRFEPNDTTGALWNLGVLGKPVSLTGLSIHNENDIDLFSFETVDQGEQSSTIELAFNGHRSDLDLHLYDDSWNLLRSSELANSSSESISLDGLPEDLYFLQVLGYEGSTSADYTLTVDPPTLFTWGEDVYEQAGANNTTSTATRLSNNNSGQLVGSTTLENLTIHSVSDVDLFRFTTIGDGSAANSVTIQYDANQGNLELDLLDGGGAVVRGSTVSAGRSRVSLEDLPAGTYYAAVNGSGNQTNGYQLGISSPRSSNSAENIGDWTIMVYMTADDLERFAFADINEMEQAAARLGSSVNIAVLWDQSAAGTTYPTPGEAAWGDVGRAFIVPDDNPATIASPFERIGEQNTSQPAALTNFIDWASDQRPADHYALIMWDHGSGLEGFNLDTNDGISQSDTAFTAEELAGVLSSTGTPIDVLAFDECLMATFEVAFSLKDNVDVIVASQELEGGAGYDYNGIFRILENTPTQVTAEQFASHIVDVYQESYRTGDGFDDTTSALRTSNIAAIATALEQLSAAALSDDATDQDWQGIVGAVTSSAVYHQSYLRDLGHFLTGIVRDSSIADTIRSAADNVAQALNSAIVNKTNDRRSSSGSTIYLPGNTEVDGYATEYSDFVTATGWGSFTDRLYNETDEAGSIRSDWSESNNSIHNAHQLGRLTGPTNIFPALNLTSNADVDWFSFQLATNGTSNDRLLVAPIKLNLNLTVTLFDQDRNQIATSGGTGDHQLTLQDFPAGNYFFRVSSTSPSVAGYVISIDAPGTAAAATLTNNTEDKARQLGTITGSRFVDKQPVQAATTAWLAFDTAVSTSATPASILVNSSQPIQAELVDASGAVISQAQGTVIHLAYTATGRAESLSLKLTGTQSDTTASLLFTVAPTAGADSFVTAEDQALVVEAAQSLLLNDSSPNSDLLKALLVTAPAHGSLALSLDGTFTYTPQANYFGQDSFVYRIDDGSALSPPSTVSIELTPLNDAPVFDGLANLTLNEDAGSQLVQVTGINAGPLESQLLRLTVSSNNTLLVEQPVVSYTSDDSSGSFTFLPLANASGSAVLTVRLEDGGLDGDLATGSDNATFQDTILVTVQAVNDLPTLDLLADREILEDAAEQQVGLTGISAGGGEIQPLQVTASSSDNSIIPAPTVQYSSADTTGSITFRPHPNAHGTVTVTVVVEDGGLDADLSTDGDNGTTAIAMVVTVDAVNDVPTLAPLVDLSIQEDADQQLVTLTGISPGPLESQLLSITATSSLPSLIQHPVLVHVAGASTATLTFTPLADANGTAVITVTVVDSGLDGTLSTTGDNLSVEQTFQVNVAAVPDVPRAVDDVYPLTENLPLVVAAGIGVLANDSDAEDDAITAELVSSTAHGILTLRSDGSFDYMPSIGFNRTDTFKYKARDATGASETATVALVVSTTNPWHNSVSPMDVNDDGDISPIDALMIILDLNQNGIRELPETRVDGTAVPLLDVNRDNRITPQDVLMIINHLNDVGNVEGEGESNVPLHFGPAASPAGLEQGGSNIVSAVEELRTAMPDNRPAGWPRQVDSLLSGWQLPASQSAAAGQSASDLLDDSLLDDLCGGPVVSG